MRSLQDVFTALQASLHGKQASKPTFGSYLLRHVFPFLHRRLAEQVERPGGIKAVLDEDRRKVSKWDSDSAEERFKVGRDGHARHACLCRERLGLVDREHLVVVRV